MYANEIYLGHGNYGVEAASRYYFGKSVKDVTLAEAALLAGIVQRPEDQSPFRNPALAAKPPLDGPAPHARRGLHHGGAARGRRGGAAAVRPVAPGDDRRSLLLRGDPAVPREDVRREGSLPARSARRLDARPGAAGLVRGGAGLGAPAPGAASRLPPASQPARRGVFGPRPPTSTRRGRTRAWPRGTRRAAS